MSSVCRYCNKVELAFDNAFKSKTGKLIPLDKTSGLPHQCSENPYSKQQQQQQQPQTPQQQGQASTTMVTPTTNEDRILNLLSDLNVKMNHAIKLLEENK